MGGNMGDLSSKENIAVIIPSFHSEVLTSICIRSFKKFCPSNINLQYIVVENSTDNSYKDRILQIDTNIKWINNNTRLLGSDANAEAVEIALKHVECKLVFICHCDVCVTSDFFFNSTMQKYKEGHRLVGTLFDKATNRIGAIHICGLFTDIDLAKKVRYLPVYKEQVQIMDVGDELTQYCRDNKIKIYCHRNTFNYPEMVKLLDKPYADFGVPRCVNDDNRVIFMHLGRGIGKTKDLSLKSNKIGLSDWTEFCNKIIGYEN